MLTALVLAALQTDEIVGDLKLVLTVVMLLLAIVAVIGIVKGSVKSGIAILCGLLICLVIYYVAQNPDGPANSLGHTLVHFIGG